MTCTMSIFIVIRRVIDILIITGKTCSGKNVVSDELINKHGFHRLTTFTTRPIRNGEVNGETYHFINTDEFMQRVKEKFFAEWKAYTTTEGVWYYGTAMEDLEKADDKTVVILTPDGYRDIKDKVDSKVVSIYLYANNATIKKRLIARGDDPKEAERRILRDNEGFKGIENEVDRIVYNNESDAIDGAVQKILKYVSEVKG